MNKPSRKVVFVIGMITWLPWVYLMSVMYISLPFLITRDFTQFVPFVMYLHIGTILITWLLIAYFCVYIRKTPYVDKDKRNLWTAVLIFGNMFATPVFWYYYFLKLDENKKKR